MKKIISLFLILLFTVSVCSCASTSNRSDLDKQVPDYNITVDGKPGLMNYAFFDNVEDLYSSADYVIVASPTESFEESTQLWYDKNYQKTDDFSKTDCVYSYTKRNFKVHKVYKGDNLELKEITVCENVVTSGDQMKCHWGDYAAEINDKYLLFLYRSNSEEETYFAGITQGKYNLDNSKNEKNKHIEQNVLKLVTEAYKDDFEQ